MNKEKAHAELSASGSERWLNCPGSVKLSRGVPEPPESKYALEGTKAHELLELKLKAMLEGRVYHSKRFPPDMVIAVRKAVDFVATNWSPKTEELITEEKISLEFIGDDMFGTADIQIIEDFGRLQVWDYKHGKGKVVEVAEKTPRGKSLNTQLVYYALGVAHKFNFNFSEIEIGVIQPRAPYTYHAGTSEDTIFSSPNKTIRSIVIPTRELKGYIDLFSRGVDRVYGRDPKLYPGRWCHWCKAKSICPKQENIRAESMAALFEDDLIDDNFNDMGF